VIVHDLVLIAYLLRQLEQQAVLEPGIFGLESLDFGFLEVAERVVATGLERVDVTVIVRSLH
jgi:hypothetical protein